MMMRRLGERPDTPRRANGNRASGAASGAGARDERRGSAVLEFALVGTVFLALLFSIFDFTFPIYAKATLHYAVRAGARYAITGETESGLGHDASIKSVVREHSFGLLEPADDELITLQYYDYDGNATTENDPGNLLVLSIENYEIVRFAPIQWSADAFSITVAASDRLEPFTTPPPR